MKHFREMMFVFIRLSLLNFGVHLFSLPLPVIFLWQASQMVA